MHNKLVITAYLSIITLNVNELNAPLKRDGKRYFMQIGTTTTKKAGIVILFKTKGITRNKERHFTTIKASIQ